MAERARVELPPGPFDATVVVPGDKSLSHRALMLAAMAEGRSHVGGLPDGADVRSTRDVLAALGAAMVGDDVVGPGFHGWSEPTTPLDCGNSGTTMRLMMGALAGAPFTSTLVGDASLSRRPMQRVVEPLRSLGARITLAAAGTAPVHVEGRSLHGGDVTLDIPSAQVRTAVAFAALHARGATTIDSPGGFRDHTEHWLVSLGRAERIGPTRLVVFPGAVPPLELSVPGDPSSAAFLWAAAAIRPGARITTPEISLNHGRLGFLRLLEAMGADLRVDVTGQVLGDPVGTVTVAHAPLRGVTVEGPLVAAAIDELPLLAVVAAAADGVTWVKDAAELMVKESNRLEGATRLARLAGAPAHVVGNGFVVGDGPSDPSDHLDAEGDHRLAMSAAIAALVRTEPVEISSFEACAVSWPGFRAALEGLWS